MRRAAARTYIAVAAVAASIVFALVAVFLAFYSQRGVTNERAQRSMQLNAYLTKQCARDRRKDAIFVGILQRSIAGAERSRTASRQQIDAYISKTRADIAAIRSVDQQCVDDIPDPIPSH